ncbi:MAG: hypothetical protein GXP25_20580 [Planctomycetes bacterium]|nr:hypothetical protein [Planctomycetota bacterium]
MRHITCAECGAKTPMNGAIKVFDRTLCEHCADQELARFQGKEVPEGVVQAQVDPTVCAICGTDCGDRELPKIAGAPMCDACGEFTRNRPFPIWIRISFALLVALVGFSIVWNFRFFHAYRERQEGIRAWRSGDIEAAANFLASVAERVPESQGAVLDAKIVRAVYLLSQDKSAEAIPLLRECQRSLPGDKFVQAMLLRAEIGAAFDRKDYDEFLKKAQGLMKINHRDSFAVGNVASAYACKYAVTGKEQFKKDALRYLEQAKRLAGKDDPEFQEYEERIRHRLESREIISQQEYERRFRKGKETAKQ